MLKYPKIQSVFKRNDEGKFTDEYSNDEIEALSDSPWDCHEKLDGMNIRIGFDGEKVTIAGRGDNSQFPGNLFLYLQELFPASKFLDVDMDNIVLFGEGIGGGIQKGLAYVPEGGYKFVLFDVKIGHWWMARTSVDSIAETLKIDRAPFYNAYYLKDAVRDLKGCAKYPDSILNISQIGTAKLEGFVLRSRPLMLYRNGNPIITKLKVKDFCE